MTRHIKLWEGWEVNHNGEKTICKSPKEVWNLFGWDIENDKEADECASMITREVYCFGFIDLTPMCNSGTLTITAILPKKGEEES